MFCLLLHRALQLHPFQTPAALTRHHDEAESEAGWAASERQAVSLSHSPPQEAAPPHTRPPHLPISCQSLHAGVGFTDIRGLTTPGFSKHLHFPPITSQQPQRLQGCLPLLGAKGIELRIVLSWGGRKGKSVRNEVLSARGLGQPWGNPSPLGTQQSHWRCEWEGSPLLSRGVHPKELPAR